MGLFHSNYENAGVGISKNEKKQGIVPEYFKLVGRKFWKLIELNLLTFLFFAPLMFAAYLYFSEQNLTNARIGAIITLLIAQSLLLGPAISGMTKVLRNFFLEKPTFMIKTFMDAFRSNFKYSLIVGVFDILLSVCIACGFKVYPALIQTYENDFIYIPFVLMISIGITVVMMNFYAFLLIVGTDLSFKNVVKDALAFAFIKLKQNLLVLVCCLIPFAIVILLIVFVSFSFILLLPFLPLTFSAQMIVCANYPVIQKYVINPFYEEQGQINPELPEATEEEVLFTDRGGEEAEIKVDSKKVDASDNKSKSHKGKVIS